MSELLLDDLWRMIFECLHLLDRNNCRLVCKRFKRIVDTIKLKELVIANEPSVVNYWHLNNKPIDFRTYITNLSLSSFQVPTRHRNLKRLKFICDLNSKFDFNQLNLRTLEHLEFNGNISCSTYQSFDLPNLRILLIEAEVTVYLSKRLEFEVPNLQAVSCNADVLLNSIRLVNSGTIKHLQLDELSTDVLRRVEFENLQTIKCRTLKSPCLLYLVTQTRISHLHLEAVSSYQAIKDLDEFFNFWNFDIDEFINQLRSKRSEVPSSIIILFNDPDTLVHIVGKFVQMYKGPKSHFNFYFRGVRVIESGTFDGDAFKSAASYKKKIDTLREPMEFSIRNYERAVEHTGIHTVNYSTLLSIE